VKVEDISSRIRYLPAFGQPGLNVEVIIAREQIVEEQVVNAFGIRVQPHSGIEIGGAALNDHHQSFGISLAGARESREEEKRGQDST